jgi:hypothetical protein
VRADAREIQDQTRAAERTTDESGRLVELDFTAALRTRDLHDAGGAMASPQLGQNFVPGGTAALQCGQVTAAARFAPHAGQNLARAVTCSPQRGHTFATTI